MLIGAALLSVPVRAKALGISKASSATRVQGGMEFI